MKEVFVNDLPEDAEYATILYWFVQEGDDVEKGDEICELSCGGKNIQIKSNCSGIITDLYCEEGDEVEPGEAIIAVDVKEKSILVVEDENDDKESAEILPEEPSQEEDCDSIYDEI